MRESMMQEKQRKWMALRDIQPRGICTCGHTGDGANSDHKDLLALGHGSCRECDCPQFSWRSMTAAARDILDTTNS